MLADRDNYWNAVMQLLHELNEREPLALVTVGKPAAKVVSS